MNAPLPLSASQVTELQRAGQLAELEPPAAKLLTGGTMSLNFPLPRQAVSLFILSW